MPDAPAINVLYIDDEPNNLTAFKAAFRRQYNIFIAESAGVALKILKENDIHVIISDQRMPDMTGIEFFESILPEYPLPARILLTGYADISAVIDAINRGKVYKYFSKPWEEKELKNNIESAYNHYLEVKKEKEMNTKLTDINDKMEFLLRQKLLS